MLKENFFNPFSNIDLQCFIVWLLKTLLQRRALCIPSQTHVPLASGSIPKNKIVESNFICIFLLFFPKLPSKYITPIYFPTNNIEAFLLPDPLLSLSNTGCQWNLKVYVNPIEKSGILLFAFNVYFEWYYISFHMFLPTVHLCFSLYELLVCGLLPTFPLSYLFPIDVQARRLALYVSKYSFSIFLWTKMSVLPVAWGPSKPQLRSYCFYWCKVLTDVHCFS